MKDYLLKYNVTVDAGHYTKPEVADTGEGLTDGLLVASLLFSDREGNEGFSAAWWSFDGRQGGDGLEDVDIFRLWMTMAAHLEGSMDLAPWQRAVAADTLTQVRAAMGIKPVESKEEPEVLTLEMLDKIAASLPKQPEECFSCGAPPPAFYNPPRHTFWVLDYGPICDACHAKAKAGEVLTVDHLEGPDTLTFGYSDPES